MIAVGIDISKGKSTVAILNSDGSMRIKPYEMHHTKPDLDALIKYITQTDISPVILMEASLEVYSGEQNRICAVYAMSKDVRCHRRNSRHA